MRLADRHGKPLSQVASEYPDWELPYWSVWMARTPTDGQRVEALLAQFLAQWVGAHMDRKKAARPPRPADFMLPDFWTEQQREARDDANAITAAFASGLKIKKGNG